jgi:arylsulfatase A-like enzyme
VHSSLQQHIKTPAADALVAEGIELNRHYAFQVCSPSRVALMTGRLPYHANQLNLANCDYALGAPENMTMLSAKLNASGYATAHFGKWDLGT